MGSRPVGSIVLSGRDFSEEELKEIQETVSFFPGLSRRELARTICEHYSWFQANGQEKVMSCLKALEKLEAWGHIKLPPVRSRKERKSWGATSIEKPVEEPLPVEGRVEQWEPIRLEPVMNQEMSRLWNEYIERYHYLGCKQAFGAQQRYFVVSEAYPAGFLGCLLYAASAWAVDCRDKWIGWTVKDRRKRLHLVVNNSRFLIFPWVRIKNLASKVLSLGNRYVMRDWQVRYGYLPVLLETFVGPQFRGTCYGAANWQYLGNTKGRGRMERFNDFALPEKRVYVYPLCHDFRAYLKG